METKKVYLVNPPDGSDGKLHLTKDMAGGFGFNAGKAVILPPLELIYHAISLKINGFEIFFYDLQAEAVKVSEFWEKISKELEPVILILVTIPSLENDVRFICQIKEVNYRARILVKVDLKEEEMIQKLLKEALVEKVLFGETEKIIDSILCGSTNDGCAYLSSGKIIFGKNIIVEQMDRLPEIDLSFLDISKYKYPLLPTDSNTFSFQSSRGCPFPCYYYCPYPLIQGRKWRAMSSDKLFGDISLLVKKFNVSSILFRDATFTLDKKRIIDFCERILTNGLTFSWWCETRMNCLDEELLKTMSKAGCRGINLGVETGDKELLEKEGKVGGTMAQLIRIRNFAKKYKIKLHFLMIIGLPNETKETLFKSFLLIKKLKPESLGVTVITPYPGTPLYKDATNNNWIINKNYKDYIGNKVVMRTKYLGPNEIQFGSFLLRAIGFFNKRRFPFYFLPNTILSTIFLIWRLV